MEMVQGISSEDLKRAEKDFRMATPGMGSERQRALTRWNILIAKLQRGTGWKPKLEERTFEVIRGEFVSGKKNDKYYAGRFHKD
jgi:hypothetical protein